MRLLIQQPNHTQFISIQANQPVSQSVSQPPHISHQSYSVRCLSIVLFAVCYMCACFWSRILLRYMFVWCAVCLADSCRYFIYSKPPYIIYIIFNTVSLSLTYIHFVCTTSNVILSLLFFMLYIRI